jgi:hypothetical protein
VTGAGVRQAMVEERGNDVTITSLSARLKKAQVLSIYIQAQLIHILRKYQLFEATEVHSCANFKVFHRQVSPMLETNR